MRKTTVLPIRLVAPGQGTLIPDLRFHILTRRLIHPDRHSTTEDSLLTLIYQLPSLEQGLLRVWLPAPSLRLLQPTSASVPDPPPTDRGPLAPSPCPFLLAFFTVGFVGMVQPQPQPLSCVLVCLQ